ncbi:carbohydrate ABC transporter permease [Salimicrobium halophilum]|uniref:Multiple sugar transport system permease protein n=1 Tax=Salimicrobium halophilum TaxID=86666 RepID=A0A1G8T7N5_9BACI|nr:sugar ABC transporter permease [Salimicrobium halophilum]SDJ37397.1 multiple sugar transport system permease protein [Salimicrobium halophilum]
MRSGSEASQERVVEEKKARMNSWKDNVSGYLFIAPMLIGSTILILYPIVASFILSLTDWNFVSGLEGASFVGLDNFITLFNNPVFLKGLVNNFILLLVVPGGLLLSLVLAVIINKNVYFKDGFKVIYFMPYISSTVAIALVFQVLFHPSEGPINQFLMSIGVENVPQWIADPAWALPSVMIIIVWTQIGFQLILYIAALQNIPPELYEAAEVDGASALYKFRKITVPLVTPTTFLLLIQGIVHTFKVFDLINVLTEGGPANATTIPVFYLYEQAFEELKTGYSSAIAVVLFIILVVITITQWFGQKKWVNY